MSRVKSAARHRKDQRRAADTTSTGRSELRTSSNRNGKSADPNSLPEIGAKYRFPCPLCDGGNADATYKVNRDGETTWFIGCFSASCQDSDYLARLAERVGARNGWELKEDPLRFLGDLIGGRSPGRRGVAEPEDLPSVKTVERWHAALLAKRANRAALAYLMNERGLSIDRITRALMGYAPPGTAPGPWSEYGAFILPIRRGKVGRGLVGLRKRFWPDLPVGPKRKPVKYTGLRGHPARLYPGLPRRRRVILCGGELDALLGRDRGLPTLATTSGASLPIPLLPYFSERPVAVIYDVGEQEAAARTVQRLRASGALAAWAVDLAAAGLEDGEDLTDWFVKYRLTADELRALIGRARRAR